MASEDFACPLKGAANTLPKVMESGIRHNGSRLEPCHVKQVGDEAVKALGFVNDRSDEIGLRMFVQCARKAPKGARGAEDSGERRLEVMRDRCEQRRAQAIRFDSSFGPVQVLDQTNTF